MSATASRPAPLTIPEFMVAARHIPGRCHLVDGSIVAMAPASRMHGGIQAQTIVALSAHLTASGSACSVIGAPGVVPHVRAKINMRVPDLAIVCPGPGRPLEGPPTLIVEILPPSNADDTWANVWAYTTIPEVLEILVLESEKVGAELLRRLPDGTWPNDPEEIEGDGDVALSSIGYNGALGVFYPPELRWPTRRACRVARAPVSSNATRV